MVITIHCCYISREREREYMFTYIYIERERDVYIVYHKSVSYKLHTDYFSLCQSVILSVLSHEEIYLNICRNVRGVLTFVIHCIHTHTHIILSSSYVLHFYHKMLGCQEFKSVYITYTQFDSHSSINPISFQLDSSQDSVKAKVKHLFSYHWDI